MQEFLTNWGHVPYKQWGVSLSFFLQKIVLDFYSFPHASFATIALSIFFICIQSLLIYTCMCIYACVCKYIYCLCVCLCIPTELWHFSCNLMCLNEDVFKLIYPLWCQLGNSRDTFFWERSPSISIWWQLLLQLLLEDVIFFYFNSHFFLPHPYLLVLSNIFYFNTFKFYFI